MPSDLRFYKRFLYNVIGSKSWRLRLCSFTEIVFSNFAAFSVSESLLHMCSNFFSCHNVFILLFLSGVTNLSLLVGFCAACMLAYRCLQMKWCVAVNTCMNGMSPMIRADGTTFWSLLCSNSIGVYIRPNYINSVKLDSLPMTWQY